VLEDTVPPEGGRQRDTQPTIGFQRVLQRALYHVQSAGKEEVLGANVLVAIFSEKDSYASYLLHRHDVTRLDVINYISHGLSRVEGEKPAEPGPEVLDPADEQGDKKDGALDRFATNLNQRARNDQIDPLIGREHEVDRTIQVLCRRRKNNPLFVGEAGRRHVRPVAIVRFPASRRHVLPDLPLLAARSIGRFRETAQGRDRGTDATARIHPVH
jgi:ATP-dependent Clp protease ATP-binding subunit ClpA